VAHERQLIHRGCGLRIAVENPNDEIAPSKDKQLHKKDQPPSLKLQVVKKGKSGKEEYEDLMLNNASNIFNEFG
jgi:hypothetical protein